MKSSELKNIKETDEGNKKKILFVNPRRNTVTSRVPHMGIAILASILKKRGHEVLVVDYSLIPNAPNISIFIRKFKPNVIGVTMYTANVFEAEEIIGTIHKIAPQIPLMVGGPHPTLYYDGIQKDNRIDYVIVGEAELAVIDIVENAKKQKAAQIIRADQIVDLDDIPFPEYMVFYKWENIRGYSIMTSRGCPYRCSFCPVVSVSGKIWRLRKPEKCIEELEYAMKTLSPNLHILVQDDNPLVDKERFYKFLRLYSEKIKLRLSVTNIRADNVNDELLTLLKEANCNDVGLGVEHAHPEVFRMIKKGETLEQIENAAKLVNKHKMLLSLCFVIGLPGDNLRRIRASIEFARRLKPDSIYWNMAIPYKSTPIREWFEEHGRMYNELGHTSLAEGDFRATEPVAETPDFTKWERMKAHYMCLFGTVDDKLTFKYLPQIFAEAAKYNLYADFFYWLPRGILKSLKRKVELVKKAHAYSHREGVGGMVKRALFLYEGR